MEFAAKPHLAEPTGPVEQALYEVRKKIYPRAVHGAFALWRWIFVLLTQLVFYGGPWLSWNGRQAVLFDLAQRKFYIFGLVFWPAGHRLPDGPADHLRLHLALPCSAKAGSTRSLSKSAAVIGVLVV